MKIAAQFFGLIIGALAAVVVVLSYIWGPGAHAVERAGGWLCVAGALLYGLGCLPRRARAWWRSTDPQSQERWEGWR